MSSPHIVFFDIETLPDLPAALTVWPQLSSYPGQTMKATINSICCVAWKVLGGDEVHCIKAWDFPGWGTNVNDDKALCEELYKILLAADCVVGHNSKRFDWRFVQTRLMLHGLPTLPKITHVDTCKESSRNLFVFNNRLQTLARSFTSMEKMDHGLGWELWERTHARDPEAMQIMEEYNKKDVIVTEEVFRRLRPVISTIPNHNLFNPLREKSCPSCGSTRLLSNGKRHTKTRSYRRYVCKDCHSWSHTDAKDEVPRSD